MIKIFIVEDDKALNYLYTLIFELNGYKIIGFAQNGQEALDKYQILKEKPDLIILDYNLPIKNGIYITKELIKLDNNLKIIMVSANDSVKKKALLAGAYCFINKPFKIKSLINKISSISEEVDAINI